MADPQHKDRWSLPYCRPAAARGHWPKAATAAWVAGHLLAVSALVIPAVQFQYKTMANLAKGPAAREFDRKYGHLSPRQRTARGLRRPKVSKGAIGRWRTAIRHFWLGRNIYRRPGDRTQRVRRPGPGAQISGRDTYLHPNMPFTVILLSPFAYLPVWAMALSFTAAKLAVVIAACLMAVRLADAGGRRMPGWVAGLAMLWALPLIIGDVQHGNTNGFVLGAIVLHLWLYRRGRDSAAGVALAVAICLKMTPALFVLYWLYQRNWKLLAAAAAAGVVLAGVVPAVAAIGICDFDVAAGIDHYSRLTGTWLKELIVPGLVKGAWYPTHINQSLSGILSRYFLSGPGGNVFWDPDYNPYSRQELKQWITLVSLSPAAVRMIFRACQAAIVCLLAWAVGWRRLPRDDGRRALHYGLVAVGMLLLNQRTWDHHAGVLLIADVAIWQAIAFGRVSRLARTSAIVLMFCGGLFVWLARGSALKLLAKAMGDSSAVAGMFADVVSAYGTVFWHFVAILAAASILAIALKKARPAYAEHRQKLFSPGAQ